MQIKATAICFLVCLFLAGCKETPSADFKIPPEEASRENPVKPTASLIADGSQVYLKLDCAVCHGKNGNGKGFMSGASRYDCRDWRDRNSLKDFTDGELFYILNKGKGNMPGYERKVDSQQAWLMVDYIRSLARQDP
ncbi:MAG: cytochrome c [Candidatus Acidiferrales bacterium]|jgi:mono/diheme cytochrome c family protein